MKNYNLALFFVVLFGITGCGSVGNAEKGLLFERTSNELDSIQTTDDEGNEIDIPRCTLKVNSILDLRHSKKGFGNASYFEKFAKHVHEWVIIGFNNLNPQNFVSTDKSNIQNVSSTKLNISLNIDILKVYIHLRATAKNANIVLRLLYNLDNSRSFSKIYRGNDTSINWTGSPEEIESAMNDAFSKALDEITVDLSNICLKRRLI